MTYGFDQCMRCGKPIPIRKDFEKADSSPPSKMTEAEWRAAGFLARPSVMQQMRPAIGCCNDCTGHVYAQTWKPGLRVVFIVSTIFGVSALIWWLMTIYFP
jgi:hypothetical protein